FSSFTLAEAPATGNYLIDGAANWVTTGTQVAAGLAGTRSGADPLLSAAYVPQPGSPLIGAAAQVPTTPVFEYYRDEQLALMGRTRASARDVGAFESTTTGPPFGSA